MAAVFVSCSKDEQPKHKKKENLRCKKKEVVCRMDAEIRERRNKLQLQHMKDLRVLYRFKEADSKYVEDFSNFLEAKVLSVVRTGRASEEIMNIIG